MYSPVTSKAAWKHLVACALLLACLTGRAVAGSSRSRYGSAAKAWTGYEPPMKQTWTASPGNVSATTPSCSWDGSMCRFTMAPIFAKSAPVIRPENFPARALAFVAAGDLFCSQFSESQCSWPCEYDLGVGCQMNGPSYYQVFNCPGSKLYDWRTCVSAPQQTPTACMVKPVCSYSTSNGIGSCTSTYASKLTGSQEMYVFGDLAYDVMPRELLGCCKGAVYNYNLNHFCDAAFDNQTGIATRDSCGKVRGCVWDMSWSTGCVPSPQTDIRLRFGYVKDPVASILESLAGKCMAIKNEQKCNSYNPVKVDRLKIKLYLAGAPGHLNTPFNINGASARLNTSVGMECPLPSVVLPGV